MKIAFFANDRHFPESQKSDSNSGSVRKHFPKADYFSAEERLFKAMERTVYDVIVVYPREEAVFWEKLARRVNRKGRDHIVTLVNGKMAGWSQTKYTVFFNGQSCVLDTQDILFLESYYRKASVVVKRGRIRIRAKLNEEEGRLSGNQFIRINRHNIINMQYIRNVKGEAVEMQNGEVLYVSRGRKKKFRKVYGDFLEENHMNL